jgi:hypothetical protein
LPWQVNTKVDMRFDIAKADWIPDEVKDAIRQKVRAVGLDEVCCDAVLGCAAICGSLAAKLIANK